MKRALLAAALLGACLCGALAGPAAAQDEPYANESGTPGKTNWTDDHSEVTLRNTSHYVARVGVFVVGDSPTDPGVGPIFVGLLVGAMTITSMGQSRVGLAGGGVAAIVTTAALAAPLGAGLLPRWLYGTVVMAMAFVAGVVYLRMAR